VFILSTDFAGCTAANVSAQPHLIRIQVINIDDGVVVNSVVETALPNKALSTGVSGFANSRIFCKIAVIDGVNSDIRGVVCGQRQQQQLQDGTGGTVTRCGCQLARTRCWRAR
jgi:hypothetical protein